MHRKTGFDYKRCADQLTAWYKKNNRNLPWRITRDPYHIWISEIMAQQTRITALLPYYQRFLTRFPSVQSLAKASLEEVLTLWAGLGYYNRARNLHETARIVSKNYGGTFPDSVEGLRALPGIGEYTAGAIASISFGKQEAAVDGNVKRVYARLFLDESATGSQKLKKNATDFILLLMPYAEPSVLTQALMELGALVCTPRRPACQECPLCAFCAALTHMRQLDFPKKTRKPPKKRQEKTVLLIQTIRGDVLLRKRTENLLKGMYQPYLLDGKNELDDCISEVSAMGLRILEAHKIKDYTHVFTHLTWDMTAYRIVIKENYLDSLPEDYSFFSVTEMEKMAIPSAFVWLVSMDEKEELKHTETL